MGEGRTLACDQTGARLERGGMRPATPSLVARAQAKIEHYLPTATDSVLCDYVLVMVGNKKTSHQVALDLEVRQCPPLYLRSPHATCIRGPCRGSGTPANVPARMQHCALHACTHIECREPRSLLRTSFAAGR
jgi:hypothetical protein